MGNYKKNITDYINHPNRKKIKEINDLIQKKKISKELLKIDGLNYIKYKNKENNTVIISNNKHYKSINAKKKNDNPKINIIKFTSKSRKYNYLSIYGKCKIIIPSSVKLVNKDL